MESNHEVISQVEHAHNLGLVAREEGELIAQRMSENHDRKRDYYIHTSTRPEFTAKKPRFNYSWLNNEPTVSSPPLLRTRNSRQGNNNNSNQTAAAAAAAAAALLPRVPTPLSLIHI